MKNIKILWLANLYILLLFFSYNISLGQINGTIGATINPSNFVVCPYTDYTIALSGGVDRFFIEGGDATVEYFNAGSYTSFVAGICKYGPSATVVVRFTGSGTKSIVLTEAVDPGSGCAKIPVAGSAGSCTNDPCVRTLTFNVQPLAHPAFGDPTVSGCTGNALALDNNSPALYTCTGTACASLATYSWKQDGTTIGGANTSSYTVPQATIDAITPVGTGQIVFTVITSVNHGPGIITCTDEARVTVTRNDPPVLGAISFGTIPTLTPALTLCANGVGNTNVSCTSGCSGTTTYTWQYKTTGAYATIPGAFSSNATTGTGPYTNTLTLTGAGATKLIPGLYDIRVIATNPTTGCSATSVEQLDKITINDLPGVEILHNYGAPNWSGATTSDNGISICTGKELQMQPRGCDATNYSNDYPANQSSDIAPNVNQADDVTPITYNTPCTGSGNDFFQTLTWSARRTTTGAALTIGGSPTLVVTNPNATSNITTIYTLLTGGVTYQLEVLGVNGCINRDSISIISTAPVISFSYPATGVTTHSSGQTITGCEGSTVTVEGLCNLCTEMPVTATWTHSAAANGLPTSPSVGNPITSAALSNAAASTYTLVMKDSTGCTGTGTINVDDVPAPVITATAVTPLCSNTNLRINLTGYNAAHDYEVYDGDPASGGTKVWDCTPPCGNPLVTNFPPVDGTNYFVKAILPSSTCNDLESTGALNVTTAPAISAWNTPTRVCNYYDYYFYLSGGSTLYTYNWTVTGSQNTGPGRAVETGSPYYSSFSWFTPPHGFILNGNDSATDNSVTLSVNASYNGCSSVVTWPTFEIRNCTDPILRARTIYSPMGQSNHTSISMQEIGLAYDFDYVCQDGIIILEVSGGDVFEWSSGETSRSISINVTSSTPDTVRRSVVVYEDTGNGLDSVKTLSHTFVVSRGGNNMNFYPEGTNATPVDTSICRNESIYVQANCPTCRGLSSYIWQSTVSPAEGESSPNGIIYQSYTAGPATSAFNVSLTYSHGETCFENIVRQVGVNTLPTIDITEVSTGATITSSSPLYLCTGDSIQLQANCSTCISSSFQWNTNATTPSVNVASQGGYYVLVEDENQCRRISPVAVVIDASDGYNSPVVANPTQICSGDDVVLEVAPCIGCSYQWIDKSSGGAIVPGRMHTTSDTGSYYAQVINPQGCVYPTSQVNVTSTNVAVPSISSTTDSLCDGGVAILATNFNSNFTYQWYWNGGAGNVMSAISGATNSTYQTSNIGTYQVVVRYPNGCISESALLAIYNSSFTPAIYSSGATICRNETVDVSTDLYAGWQYQWYRNGILVPGATGSVYSAATGGSYYVRVTNYNSCVEQTSAITLNTASIPIPNASTGTPTVCPGENGELSVSLCSGCSYQWFNDDGIAISVNSTLGYNYNSVTTTDNYYAVVSLNGCSENSDTVSIVINSVFTPAINTTSNVVCDGRNALLFTPRCSSCSYSWLINGSPVLGALNDTFHLVDNPIDSGDYQIAVTYPNGCSDTSAILTINDGSYVLSLDVQSLPVDYVICNGVGENLEAVATPSLVGTYFYTLYLNNTPVTGFSNVTSNVFSNRNIAGVYTVESTDPRGCRELSNFISLSSVTVQPQLESRATSNPSSVTASAICTDTGTVFLQVSNCVGCTFEWTLDGDSIGFTGTTYTSAQGDTATGTYIVIATNNGCSAVSNPVSIADLIGSIDSDADATDTSICNGQSVTLEHEYSFGNPTLNCNGCSFRWLRGSQPPAIVGGVRSTGNPINGASNYQYIAGTPGYYYLELTTAQGCVDTSVGVRVRQVDPPVGMMLAFDTAHATAGVGTPLASNGSLIDMNYWVFPSSIRYDSLVGLDSSYFTSSPFSGALSPNAGLSGIVRDTFIPADSLAGYHLVTYHYITQGCEFTVDDVLEVLPPAAITVTNVNPSSVPYEACVGDSLVIQTVNLRYPIDSVFAFDVNDIYVPISVNIISTDTNVFGVDTFYSTTIGFEVPGYAYASYLLLRNLNGTMDTTTPFVLIHNTDLSFTGLPNMLCSNGTGITLFGNPSGGIFTVRDTTPAHNIYAGIVTGNVLTPSLLNPALYQNGRHAVDVFYSYTETYTNGNLCPSFDTVSQRMEVKDVRLTSVQFNKVSVSQDKELLTDLVYRVQPYRARANMPNYEISFAGSFTFPAGNPTYFLPKNAGVGFHPLTYRIKSGDCINSMTSNIQVIPAPAPINLPDTICRNQAPVTFGRSPAYPYLIPSPLFVSATTAYIDTFHVMRVRTFSGQGLTVLNPNPGVEQYIYNPAAVLGNIDTLIVEYWFERDEDSLGLDLDKLDYVVGRVYQPVYIEDLDTVSIIDTIVNSFYCEEDVLHLLAGNPTNNSFGDGLFMLYGGTGQYATGDTLPNSVINPYQVNGSEGTVTNYDLVYILNGAVCKNSDTMSITISKGLYPSFVTSNGMDEFCDSDPAVTIIHNVSPPDTAIWKIGGVPQSSYTFAPQPLDPGIHVVELQMVDTFGCSATAKDTFTIHALPALTMTPGLAPQYCANDPVVNFVVAPSPGCPSYLAPGQYILDEKFNSGIPPTWTIFGIAGKPWTPTAVLAQGGLGGAAFVDTSQVAENTWLVTDSLSFIQGHTYRISYMVRAGVQDPTCSGFCDASLRVMLGSVLNPNNLTGQIDIQTNINNDATYVPYSVNYTHTIPTGKYFMAFHDFTPAKGRSLRLDNVLVRDLTIGSCNLGGIGYVTGPGAHSIRDSLYQFNPLAVDPGNIEVKYIYKDVNGCQDSLVYPVLVDSFPIVSFTNLDSSYCENEPTIMLTGSPLGGAFTSTLTGNLTNIPFTAPLDTAWYPVHYLTNVSGTDIVSYSYTDGNGCSSIHRDTVVVVPMLDSAIVDNALDPFGIGHCEAAAPSVLDYIAYSGAPLPGAFYGPGVRNGLAGPGAAMFHPDSAVIDMGHTGNVTITYIYMTTTNCMDTTRYTTEVHAMPDLSFMNLPDSMCLNAGRFQVVVINSVVTGTTGQINYQDTLGSQTGTFSVTDLNGIAVPIMGLFDSLTPSLATGYNELFVSYSHTVDTALGGCTSTIYDSIRIDTIPIVYFQGMKDFYCENEPQSIILAFPPYKVGSGYMLIDTLPIDTSIANVNARIDSSFYWINPLTMISGSGTTTVYPSYYTYTDNHGCRGEVYDTFEIRPFPRIVFSPTFQTEFCRQLGTYNLMQEIISPLGGYFTDNLALTSIINDSLLDLNSLAGPRLITYHFQDTNTTCYNNDSIWINLYNSPYLDFNVFGGCSVADITFDGYATNLILGIDSITSITWDFDTPSTPTPSGLDTTPITIPDITHQYPAAGTYNATLYVENQGICTASVTKPVIISPSVTPTPYFEDFETGTGNWYNDQAITTTPSNIWSHTTSLGGNKINDPGNGAWVTMGDSLYQPGQSAWVYSPCFDFTNSRRPMIAFDLWRDMLVDIDGVVMEFYNYPTNTWERVGDVGEGINWYQSDFVLGRPGNQANVTYPRGWTGRSNGFQSARLRLDPFRGQTNVRFRLAFASSPQTVITDYEGAAFDNVWVGERTRNVLVEHFDHVDYVNPGGQNSDVIDQSVYDKIFNTAYGVDVTLIQYQTQITNLLDPVNIRTRADVAARTYLYGINSDNQYMLDGRKIGNGISYELDEYSMDYDMLQFPDFNITITTPTITGNTLNVTSTTTALKNLPIADYAVHTVIIQDSLTINANGFDMLSVMRKMLPNPAGTRYNQAWSIGNAVTTTESWDFSAELGQASFNSNQLEVVVFIQDMNSKEVFQVHTTQNLNKFTGTGQLADDPGAEITDLKVYPNPSSDLFNVEFDKELKGAYNWRLIDVTGRILQTGIAEQGTKTFTIDAEKLTNGAYFFVINSDTVYAQRKLVVIK